MSDRLAGSPRRGAGGFTLVEALAALVLVGIVLPVAMRGMSLALSMGSDTVRRTKAVLLAQSKMEELVATGAWEDSALEGDFNETPSGESVVKEGKGGETEYRWSATVEDWLDISVKQLTVHVTWGERDLEREVVLTTLIYSESEDT